MEPYKARVPIAVWLEAVDMNGEVVAKVQLRRREDHAPFIMYTTEEITIPAGCAMQTREEYPEPEFMERLP